MEETRRTGEDCDCISLPKEAAVKETALDAFIRRIKEGIEAGGLCARAGRIDPLGLRGTSVVEVLLDDGTGERPLMHIALYCGRPPHYRPWAEVFCINPECSNPGYYDSPLEDTILSALRVALGPAGRIFIEYYSDTETAMGLSRGFPPASTRQGFRLFNQGYTWFKDWYFSEGGHEGGQKLQGEIAIDVAALERQTKRMREETERFIALPCSPGDDLMERAVKRGREVLRIIDLKK